MNPLLSLRPLFLQRMTLSVCALAALAWAVPGHADKPEWAGGGGHKEGGGHKHKHHERSEGHDELRYAPQKSSGVRVDIRVGGYFAEPQRVVVYQDYQRQIRAGHCPPGLAKKGNGCLPPGQAKKMYVVGRPLPPGVVYYDLPPQVSVSLGVPPSGHRFVRVAADILLIAVGSGMVIDAMGDLGR